MTKASRDKIEKDMEGEEKTQTLEETRDNFEGARETHLMPGITDDPLLISERQEHEHASLFTRQGTAVYPEGQPRTDQSLSKIGLDHPYYPDEFTQRLFKIEN